MVLEHVYIAKKMMKIRFIVSISRKKNIHRQDKCMQRTQHNGLIDKIINSFEDVDQGQKMLLVHDALIKFDLIFH